MEDIPNEYLLRNFGTVFNMARGNYQLQAYFLSRYSTLKTTVFDRTGRIEELDDAICKAEQAVAVTPGSDPQRARLLGNLGDMLQRRFDRVGRTEDLEKAMRIAEQALSAIPGDSEDMVGTLESLSNMLLKRFELNRGAEDLEAAIRMAERAVEATPKDHPDLASFLNNLGHKLLRRFERAGRPDDLDKAICIAKQALEVTPKDHPDQPARLCSLGNKLLRRFEWAGKVEDLEEAIAKVQRALAESKDRSDRTNVQNALACLLEARFSLTGKREDLEGAIRLVEPTIMGMPKNDPNYQFRLNSASRLLGRRFDQIGRVDDLKESLRIAELAVDATPIDHPDRVDGLNNLANALLRRFMWTGAMGDLEEAIHMVKQALKATPEIHPAFVERLDSLGYMLEKRFEQTGSKEDLEESIRLADQAFKATPKEHPHLPERLHHLATRLYLRFGQTGRMDDLEQAIHKAVKAVESTPETHPKLAPRLNCLGALLQKRSEETGRKEDLDNAIVKIEQALEITPKAHPERAAELNNLGFALEQRFQRTGAIEDLNRAIRMAEEALERTPEDHPDFVGRLDNLGNKLERRFERTGRVEDLEEAIHKAKQASQATGQTYIHLALLKNNLSTKLWRRFDRIGRMEDIEEAILNMKQSLKGTPEDSRDLSGRLNNLSIMLLSRFEENEKMEDLEEAIRTMKHALNSTPEGRYIGGKLNNLAAMLRMQFERTRTTCNLEEAICKADQAVKATPEHHADLAGWLLNLGRCLSLSPEVFYNDRALDSFLKSWRCTNGIPFHRVASAHEAIKLLQRRKEWSQACEIAKQAIRLLPVVTNRSLNREDQQYAVSTFSGLAANACSLMIQEGDDGTKALEILELGRGVILGLLIDSRSDISELKSLYPEKAATYERLRAEMNLPIHDTEPSSMRKILVKRRIAAAGELEDCIHSIRQIRGQERFLLGPTAEELKKRAQGGWIVIINISDIRSDAIIVSTSAIKAIELPGLTISSTRAWMQHDLTRYETLQEYGKNNKNYSSFLSWLWLHCVKIVIQELEISENPASSSLQRIWWIGVGVASLLPFHAAGDHSSGSIENTFSRAVSSYTPTIKALQYARERAYSTANFRQDKPKLLIVTMPTTPGENDLNATEEKVEIVNLVGNSLICEPLDGPDARTVLKHLPHVDMAHFACHGVSDHADPSNSSLVLQKCKVKNSAPDPDPLTVRQVSEINLKQARIAYLSACSTAENKAQRLADEVIHLASGFQVAGFSHVIATLWPSDDDVSVEMAKEFYKRLGNGQSSKAVSTALHQSVIEVRSKLPNEPLCWAQYIHYGA